MTGLVRLGLRLSGGGGARERTRGLMIAFACAIGVWLLMNLFAITRAETAQSAGLYTQPEMQRLLVAVLAALMLPVVVLVSTASRLSASVRDRRLASLRLIGLSPSQTRLVAAIEVGATAVVGALVGVAAFYPTRSAVVGLQPNGRDWSQLPFAPWPLTIAAAAMLVPLAAIVVSLIPTRGLRNYGLARAHQTDARHPSPWRLAPIGVGVVLIGWAITHYTDGNISNREFAVFAGGVLLTGVGLVVCVPVFVRLVADLALRVSARPTIRIAARRLQAQPAGVSRIVAGMLIGLFLVSGARCVVVAFEQATNFAGIEREMKEGPQELRVEVRENDDGPAVVAALETVDGIDIAFQELTLSTCPSRNAQCLAAFVGTCDALSATIPDLRGCRNDTVAWINGTPGWWHSNAPEYTWREGFNPRRPRAGEGLVLPAPSDSMTSEVLADNANGFAYQASAYVDVFIPEATHGVGRLNRHSASVFAYGVAGPEVVRRAQEALDAQHLRGFIGPTLQLYDYYFVLGLQAIVWSIAAVILSVGLLAFAIAAIDRAITRREEMVKLQVIGTPVRTLRTTQWLESLLTLGFGLPLAIGLGWWAGTGYLVMGGEGDHTPWADITVLGALSLAAAVVVAGLTVVASSPRIRADLIRDT